MSSRAVRSSTRTRTQSQEPGSSTAPAKVSPQKKQPALRTVPESPAKRSSGAFSGTTAQQSLLVPSGLDESSEQLVGGLSELWDTSEQFLNRIIPDPVTSTAVDDLETRLRNAPRYRNDVLARYQRFKDSMELYPEMPINAGLTCLQILGLTKTSELREEPYRPDEIIYRANLAYVMGIFAERLLDDIEDLDFEELLQIFTKSLFSKVLKSNERSVVGSTHLLKPTFELAIDLSTHICISTLEDSLTDGSSELDLAKLITDTFYKDGSSSSLRGWPVPGLQTADLTKHQRMVIAERISNIRNKTQNYPLNDDLQELKQEFPVRDLVHKFFLWADDRNKELVTQIKQTPNGPLGIQEAIDAEISRIKAQTRGDDVIQVANGRQQNSFAIPAKPARSKMSKKEEIYNTMRASVNPSRPQSSAAASTFTAPVQPSMAARQSRSSRQHTDYVDEDEFQPTLFVGDEANGQDDDQDVQSELDANQAKALSQAVMLQDQQANKENFPQPSYHYGQPQPRSFLDPQPNAQALDWQTQNTYSNKGKRRMNPVEFDDEQDDDEQGSQISQDAGFETQQTPTQGPSKRVQLPTRRAPISRTTIRHSAPVHPMTNSLAQAATQLGTQEPLSLRTQAYQRINAEAKIAVSAWKASQNNVKQPQKRKAWTPEETDQLLRLIELYGTSWSLLKGIDNAEHGGILNDRDQVALKDKARNIKMDFLKAGNPPPPNFDGVALKSADITKLHDLNRDPNLPPQGREYVEIGNQEGQHIDQ